MRELSALELQAHLENGETQPLLLDVRQPWELDICKLENCVFIPMSQIPAKIDSLDTARETVVICHHGIRSRSVGPCLKQDRLEHAGFSNIINLSGGVDQWAKTVDKQMATY
jgi:rhodanese-related sulfurtransferase